MTNGVSATGFRRKRLKEILTDKNAAVKGVFGENINLSPESPDGQINGVMAESDANLWELAEACYQAFNPAAATGVTLSNLVQLNNIKREAAIATTVLLEFTGVSGTVIAAGSLVSTSDSSITVATDAAVTITAGAATVLATNVVVGEIGILADTLTKIDSPITGWGTANNSTAGVVGQNEETDPELRARRIRSVSRSAVTPLDSIVAEVLAVPLTTYAFGFENNTDTTDGRGIPAHAVLVVVEGGDDDDVAQAILEKKATGITSSGASSGTATDSQGIESVVNFERPSLQEIHVLVELNTFADFPINGVADIKANIVAYATGLLIEGKGFGVADDVIRTELYTAINQTVGQSVSVIGIKNGSAASAGDISNIAMAFNEKASFLATNIVATIL